MNILRRPLYYSDFIRVKQSLVFIAADRMSAHIIRRIHGTCLLCEEPAENYDLDFCNGHEVWVLYVYSTYFFSAMQLARTAQWYGASHVCIIKINKELIHE